MVSKEYIITGAMLMLVTYTFGLSLITQAYPAGQTTKILSSTGSIQIQTTAGIGIYADYGCTTPLTSVSWGTLQPGGSTNVICYIKNEGNAQTTLSITGDYWTPQSASEYLTLTSNYSGQPINPQASIPVILTLSVAANVQDSTQFSFEIIIAGSS